MKSVIGWLLVFALTMLAAAVKAQSEDKQQAASSPITKLGSEYQNSIELLKNRFRIDHHVDEITMVFFREYGSLPVVLVRPDGSKIFQSQADGQDIAWYDAETYDMVQIKNPVPGPWQAVGQVLQDSRIMVLSDISLQAKPLPSILFSGEILKHTARLTNNGEAIDYGPFRDVVELVIELASTNNPDFDNFGAPAQEIARYEDNGRGMDERPLDGEFSGQFNLSIAPGEWRPVFRVITPMFTREQVDPLITLHPTPISIQEVVNGGGENYHKLLIDVNRDLVDINSLLVDGKVQFPNGDIQNFSLTELSDQIREHMIVAYEDGVFRVKLTAFGKTINGRDFIIDVPEYSFLVKTEVPVDNTAQDQAQDTGTSAEGADGTEADFQEVVDPVQPEAGAEKAFPLAMIIWINVGILLCGSLLILTLLIMRNGAPAWLAKPASLFSKKPKPIVAD